MMMSDEVEKAFEVIKKAMIDDNPSEQGSYAHSWHCNIAMMCADAIHAERIKAAKEATLEQLRKPSKKLTKEETETHIELAMTRQADL